MANNTFTKSLFRNMSKSCSLLLIEFLGYCNHILLFLGGGAAGYSVGYGGKGGSNGQNGQDGTDGSGGTGSQFDLSYIPLSTIKLRYLVLK